MSFRLFRRLTVVAVLVLAGAGPGLARDAGVALVIANARYDRLPAPEGAAAAGDAARALTAARFEVMAGQNLTAAQMRDAFAGFLEAQQALPDGRIVIVLAGQFVHAGRDVWMLGRDVQEPGLATADMSGLRLGPVLEAAARVPGGALVLLASDHRYFRTGAPLVAGLPGGFDIPQGVTLVTGPAGQLAGFVEDVLQPGADPQSLVSQTRFLRLYGFTSPRVPFTPVEQAVATAEPIPAPPPVQVADPAEQAAWDTARRTNTIAGYETYLRNHPGGANASAARVALDSLRADPVVQAQAAEEALNLTRDQRREIQRALSLLGYNTRGIDGIFGPGTRGAITEWQRREGLGATGHLNRDQITRLSAQADRRAAELEAEAEARRAEQERQDRAFWAETGVAGDEPGLRAYLRRFPDGVFSDLARERIAAIEGERATAAAARDREAWRRAERQNSVASYRGYLAEFPQGAFAGTAEARIAELTDQPDESAAAAARAAEEALNLNGFTRNVLESRLAASGFDPGPVDGVFDEATRRAIRQFQRARDLPVTGYLDERAVVALLAGALGRRN